MTNLIATLVTGIARQKLSRAWQPVCQNRTAIKSRLYCRELSQLALAARPDPRSCRIHQLFRVNLAYLRGDNLVSACANAGTATAEAATCHENQVLGRASPLGMCSSRMQRRVSGVVMGHLSNRQQQTTAMRIYNQMFY